MPAATIEDALALVVSNLRGMTDKDGEPYVMHCLRVMMGVTETLARQVALMHDLVEDTAISLDDLRQSGFASQVVEAVGLLTHQPEDSYAEYVVRLQPDALARQVKLSDLRPDRRASDLARIQRYLLSYQFLSDRIDEASYREQMRAFED